LLNNPAICCSSEGGSICDDFYNENDNKLKNDNLKVSNLLKDNSLFYRDYIFSEKNSNFIIKKFIEKKGDEYYYNNPLIYKEIGKSNNISNLSLNQTNNSVSINNNTSNNISDKNNYLSNDEIDYGNIVAENNLIIKEVIFTNFILDNRTKSIIVFK